MYKIRKIQFKNHKVLGNLVLDFCDLYGKAVDTVIFAGENGCGKSTILNEIYKLSCGSVDFQMELEFELSNTIVNVEYYKNKQYGQIEIKETKYSGKTNILDYLYTGRIFKGIFSDVDINFHAKDLSTVTSLTLDSESNSRRSSNDLPTKINQLLIDIQTSDDGLLAKEYRETRANKGDVNNLTIEEKMPRFIKAFNCMFEGLEYSHIENRQGKKEILFKKNNLLIPIDSLSSGEKQIVYRGCFLLKDINALNGAFVFIDEPEISLHPNWQKKIMDYYKGIFTNSEGVQTSQIFAVTHSPFIIHNENRKNDKVIVLTRDEDGKIIVKDKPEYFKCDSMAVIQDAFSIHGFSSDKSFVYLEGRTDEKYFKKAMEVFDFNNLPFEFKWIGHIDEKGQEANTGKDALNKAVPFLISQNLPYKNICLYDCDANKPQKQQGNVISLGVPKFDNDKSIAIGIENALVFEDIDIEPYKKQHVEVDGYGIEKRIPDFQKMACCDYICSLETERLQRVFVNLKSVIEMLITLFKE